MAWSATPLIPSLNYKKHNHETLSVLSPTKALFTNTYTCIQAHMVIAPQSLWCKGEHFTMKTVSRTHLVRQAYRRHVLILCSRKPIKPHGKASD